MFKVLLYSSLGIAVLVAGLVTGGISQGYSIGEMLNMAEAVVRTRRDRKSTDDRIREIESKKPELRRLAHAVRDGLSILVFKRERTVEVWAKAWPVPRIYAMTGFSGRLGPKLEEGDGQIPEGAYGIEYLNPNSLFHLSLKVSYPNEFDRQTGKSEGRERLGGDIMIHGGEATVGCIPIGDDKIEEVFYLAAKAGVGNVTVIISPYDMRKGRDRKLEDIGLPWYKSLRSRFGLYRGKWVG